MNALVMIQPALLSYSLNQQGPPQPVLLDAQALKVRILRLSCGVPLDAAEGQLYAATG